MTLDEEKMHLHDQGGFNTADDPALGYPGFQLYDGPHGVRYGMATSFPVSIGMATTWDVDIIRQVGVALGRVRVKDFTRCWVRPWIYAAIHDTAGAQRAAAKILTFALKSTTSLIKGAADHNMHRTAKHYNCNGKENNRTNNNVSISQRMLMEEYGLNFRTAVQEGGVMCVMNAYNLINGESVPKTQTCSPTF